MKMTKYAIYRHGLNAANQGMTPRVLVAIVEAPNRQEAAARVDKPFNVYSPARLKLAPTVTFWANQHAEVVPVSRIGKREINEYYEREARDEENEAYAAKHVKVES